jgi:hypothetical protein
MRITAGGSTHQALTPAAAIAAVAPIANAISTLTRQSSPTTESHQNLPNAPARLMRPPWWACAIV